MLRISLVGFAIALLTSGQHCGAQWPGNAFPVRKHDFGTVAVASKTEFKFPVQNTLANTMHIRSVRASCGCTTPVIVNHYINPGETGHILARFNTRTFKGQRGATLTVVIDQPFFSEVQLRVDGYIRSDMVFHPGAVDFGRVSQGDKAARVSKLMYAGRDSWEITDIRSNQPWLMAKFTPTRRGSGRVDYDIHVDLREDAPTGPFQDELLVITNDRSRPRVPLKVSGTVESALSISPQSFTFGSLQPGQTVKQMLVVRGRAPFLIESLTCPGWKVTFERTTVAKSTHVIPVKFTATEKALGPQKVMVEIKTAGEKSVTAKALLTAHVRQG